MLAVTDSRSGDDVMTSPMSGPGANRDDAQLRAPSPAAAAVELSCLRGGTQTSELSPYAPCLRSVHAP